MPQTGFHPTKNPTGWIGVSMYLGIPPAVSLFMLLNPNNASTDCGDPPAQHDSERAVVQGAREALRADHGLRGSNLYYTGDSETCIVGRRQTSIGHFSLPGQNRSSKRYLCVLWHTMSIVAA